MAYKKGETYLARIFKLDLNLFLKLAATDTKKEG
jgi:hypothetical protein